MTTTLSALISEVEGSAPSTEPLDLLATASATVDRMSDLTDALLSHFVDRSRRAGHSWTEIGAALGVTKQAVQKRFTATEQRTPRGWDHFTERARNIVDTHAVAAAEQLGHNYIGTEHLLAAMWGEPKGVAAQTLDALGLTRETVIAAIEQKIGRNAQGRGGYTPRAWVAVENASRVADDLGHNFVGTEHILLSLMTGVGGVADKILTEAGIKADAVRERVLEVLKGFEH